MFVRTYRIELESAESVQGSYIASEMSLTWLGMPAKMRKSPRLMTITTEEPFRKMMMTRGMPKAKF